MKNLSAKKNLVKMLKSLIDCEMSEMSYLRIMNIEIRKAFHSGVGDEFVGLVVSKYSIL